MLVAKALAALRLTNDRACRLGVLVATALLAAMLGIILTQVALRWGIGASISWSEEIAKTCMTWGALFAAPDALRRDRHLRLLIFIDALPVAVARSIRLAVSLSIMFVCGTFLIKSFDLIGGGMAIRADSVDAPAGMFYVALPASMTMFLFVSLEQILLDIRGERNSAPMPADN